MYLKCNSSTSNHATSLADIQSSYETTSETEQEDDSLSNNSSFEDNDCDMPLSSFRDQCKSRGARKRNNYEQYKRKSHTERKKSKLPMPCLKQNN